MPDTILRNPPLVEAILEVHWDLPGGGEGPAFDPAYKLVVGRLFDRLNAVEKRYPYHQPLPTASMPDELLGHIVQHQFRVAKDAWPLVQLGPGVVTLNITLNALGGYRWDDFRDRACELLNALFDSYPDGGTPLRIASIQLRYIDAIEFSFEQASIFEFMANDMQITVSVPPSLFQNVRAEPVPRDLNIRYDFPTIEPLGLLRLQFARGRKGTIDQLVWETIVISNGGEVPALPGDGAAWLNAANTITHNFFFNLIRPRLLERFV